MPTLIREAGFEVRIYTLDYPPPHVHVARAGAIVKVDLATFLAIGQVLQTLLGKIDRLGVGLRLNRGAVISGPSTKTRNAFERYNH